jgi:hypothetical protein
MRGREWGGRGFRRNTDGHSGMTKWGRIGRQNDFLGSYLTAETACVGYHFVEGRDDCSKWDRSLRIWIIMVLTDDRQGAVEIASKN